MKKTLMLLFVIISLTLFTECKFEKVPTDELYNGANVEDDTFNTINFLDDIYGVYGEYDENCVSVFPGKDDEHININYFEYRLEFFDVKDIKITKLENGTLEATKIFEKAEVADDLPWITNNTDPIKLYVSINDNVIKLIFDKKVLIYGDSNLNTEIEMKKDNRKVIDECEKAKAIDLVLKSDFKNINSDVFEVVKDTKTYLVLKTKCFIYAGLGYNMEGSEAVGTGKYYNFDKKSKKLLTLNYLTKNSEENMEKLNKYIKNEIEKRKLDWSSDFSEPWPYKDFKGIGNSEYIENYFMIDGDKQIVKIRCLEYPNMALRALGDIDVEIPFSFFETLE